MKAIIAFLIIVLLSLVSVQAAEIELTISDKQGGAISDAHLFFPALGIGGSSDMEGNVRVSDIPDGEHEFVVSHLGHVSQSLTVLFVSMEVLQLEVTLESNVLEQDTITKQVEAGTGLHAQGPRPVEVISRQDVELNTGGALDLIGDVEGVDTKPCALCGSSGVGMQGLDASYTEVQQDGLTVMSGVGSLYGMEGVDDENLQKVELTRGSTSAKTSGAAIAGQVNLVSTPVSARDTMVVSLALGDNLRNDAGFRLGGTVLQNPTRLSVNWTADPSRIDGNNDNLTDAPELSRLNARLEQQFALAGAEWNWQLGGYTESRFAGDVDWNSSHKGSVIPYGRSIEIDRLEGGVRVNWKTDEHVRYGFASAGVIHRQESWYGATSFDATQLRGLANLNRQQRNSLGEFQVELGATMEDYQDNLDLGNPTDRSDFIPHALVQQDWEPHHAWKLETGLRLESHREEVLVPLGSASVRWQMLENWSMNLGAGQGYRPITLFSLDKAVHAGFDDISLPAELKPERSLSLNWALEHSRVTNSVVSRQTLRLFATEFSDKAILAYGDEVGVVEYANASRAWSRGVSLNNTLSLANGLRFQNGASVSRVRYERDGEWHAEHMLNEWTASSGVRYRFPSETTTVGLKVKVFGPQELPEGRDRGKSPVWATWDLLAEQKLGKLRLVLNVDNLLGWTQPDSPFMSTPEGNLIDSAMIYGPLVGRRWKLGLTVPVF